jgi:hypothetical protein
MGDENEPPAVHQGGRSAGGTAGGHGQVMQDVAWDKVADGAGAQKLVGDREGFAQQEPERTHSKVLQ